MPITEIKNKYLVSGGYRVEIFETDNYSDGLKEFLNRIKLTKPFTNETITFYTIAYIDDLWVAYKILHRVILN